MIEFFLSPLKILAQAGSGCKGEFFGLPAWYRYLDKVEGGSDACARRLNGINDIWLIALAITEILLRIAIIVAITYVVVGGIKYITSEGNPEKTSKAKNTVLDGLIGLIIAVVATAVVSYIARRFQG